MQFDLAATADKSKARFGEIQHQGRKAIATPTLIANAYRGCVPNLTQDLLKEMPIEMVHLSLEQFLDYDPPLYSRSGLRLRRFLGLEKVQQGGPLLSMSLRDPCSDSSGLQSSGDAYTWVKTSRGSAKVTVAKFLEIAAKTDVEMLLAMADEPENSTPGKRRLHNSIVRTKNWLEVCILDKHKEHRGVQKPVLGVSLQGSSNEIARQAFANGLGNALDGAVSLNDDVDFYYTKASLGPDLDRTTLFAASLDKLTPKKLRIAANANGPHDILRLIAATGFDCFIEQWTFDMANLGGALDFDFPAKSETSEEKRQIGLNLFEDRFADDFHPLSVSSLAAESDAKQPTTRAYLHHLLWSHEMTAHILLTLHNVRVMYAFMERVRLLLHANDGSFENAMADFEEAYADDHAFAKAAKTSWSKVNGERGRGRGKARAVAENMAQITNEPESETVVIDQNLAD